MDLGRSSMTEPSNADKEGHSSAARLEWPNSSPSGPGCYGLGGVNPAFDFLPEVDPLNYVSRVTTPLLLLSGELDHIFSLEASAKLFSRNSARAQPTRGT